jgi:hypothetical protein
MYKKSCLHPPIGRTNYMQTYLYFFVATLPQKGVPSFNKSQFGAKVRSIAKTFIMESTCELPPPLLEVKITRLYILLLETNIFTEKKQLEKPKNTMVFPMKLVINGILINMFVLTFGQWYFYPPMSTLQLLYLI